MGKLKIISYSDEPFRDRVEAGKLLGKALAEFKNRNALVLGIPRGGIIIADQIARLLDAELDILLSRKIGAPGNPELAIGAISEGGNIFLNERVVSAVGADEYYIQKEKERQLSEIKSRIERYRKIRPKVALKGRQVIVTDDGVATGATMLACLWASRKEKPEKLIAALPVGPQEALEDLADSCDEVIALKAPAYFGALSQFYLNFEQTSDSEVADILKEAAVKKPASPAGRGNL